MISPILIYIFSEHLFCHYKQIYDEKLILLLINSF